MGASGMAETGVLAVDVGGTRLRTAVFDTSGELRGHEVRATPAAEPGGLAAAMLAAVASSGLEVHEAVVGVPGVIDYERGECVVLPHLPEWQRAITARGLSEATGLVTSLWNDADLAALGEWHSGAGQGTRHMVYVTCSTGVGAGVIIDGRLLRTRTSLAEVGHTIIDWRTGDRVESIGSGSGILARTGETAPVLAARALAGDEVAALAFREAAEAFAAGVQTLAYCFMPDRIVIGGGVAQTGDLLFGPVRARIEAAPLSRLRGEDIVPARWGDDVGLRGGYAAWLELRATA